MSVKELGVPNGALVVAMIIASTWMAPLRADQTTQSSTASGLDSVFKSDVQPLIKLLCFECHSGNKLEAEIDFAAFTDLALIQKQTDVWRRVSEMISSEQMPPRDSMQPTADQRAKISQWLRTYLAAEAAASAGDPGPVVLRRLSNAEYTYTLRDLTSIETLDPAKEFPVDSASGEGFTNVGNSLVMSPSMLTKYMDAAKEVASHAVLLPTGIRFSRHNTQRDWTNELLSNIRRFYSQYSGNGGGSPVDLQGIKFDTNLGGRLPLERYLLATIEERSKLALGKESIESVANERGLSPKYLSSIWTMLNTNDDSFLFEPIRAKWRYSQSNDLALLVESIKEWQNLLFKFNSVGQIGLHKETKSWLAPVSPLVDRQEFRVRVPADAIGDVILSLCTEDAGDGNLNDQVLWEHPRFVAPGRPDLLLKDVGRVVEQMAKVRDRHFAQVANCLVAAAEAEQSATAVELTTLAEKHSVDTDSLRIWLEYLGIGTNDNTPIGTPISRKLERVETHEFIKGWVGDEALSVLANSSDQHVRIPGNIQPHSIAVHPTPTLAVVVGWRSPVSTQLKITGSVQHAHPECGNGTGWAIELRQGNTRRTLAAGKSKGSKEIAIGPLASIDVRPGDLITFAITPQDNNHSCDLTAINLILSNGTTDWNLWQDVSPAILAGKPHADRQGNTNVWYFFSEPATGSAGHQIPVGSQLAKWQAATDPKEKLRLATEVQRVLQSGPAATAKESADASFGQQLRSINGPFMEAVLRSVASQSVRTDELNPSSEGKWGLPLERFGMCPDGRSTEPANLCVHAPETIELRLPAELVAGAEFVVSGLLHPETGRDGSVRLSVRNGPAGKLPATAPIVTYEQSPTRGRIENAFNEFRRLFPPTLCYTQIVPIDEVVTLTLYYREDEPLQRLMLTTEQSTQLDQMWDELFYVSHEPIELVTAITQLYQFATQDRPDMLPLISAQQQPVQDRANAFGKRLIENEPQQLDALVQFARKAYRRPLTALEETQLRRLYMDLRQQELLHDDAMRLMVARVLVSPSFLYKLEKPASGSKSSSIADFELASRLSFFLWASAPDQELLSLASLGELNQPNVLAAQTKRMLQDSKARRLATEFGCQWLHLHDFENHNEKSERHFPTFAALRKMMYEESILVLTDFFQNNRAIIDLIDGNATFLNEDLAEHYGVPDVMGTQWRRVEGVRQYSRGSILSMASTLSKQSGASRTSPILRGTWLSEVILGEKLPKPPKSVPVLSEEVPDGLTERQLIARHTSDPACAKCHARIDPFGFALEGFDAIGRLRTANAAGLTIDAKTILFDGTNVDGLEDLKRYLYHSRRDAVVRQFVKKLLGYSLGRSVQLSDEPLLTEIQNLLSQNDYRVGVAIEAIVCSPQFREIRGLGK